MAELPHFRPRFLWIWQWNWHQNSWVAEM